MVDFDGRPIGPTWQGEFFLGADSNGRDSMVRLLYGGRNSLLIGLIAAIGTTLFGVIAGILAGYRRGWTDGVISRILDILWAFPVIILGIALGTALAEDGLKIGPLEIAGGSLAIPMFIIAIIYIPYIARPLRGQVLSLREKEFVEAARAQGAGTLAGDVQRDPAEHRLDDHRVLPAPGRERDPARGRPLVPRRRRPAARAVLGHDDPGGRRADRRRLRTWRSSPARCWS